MQEMQSLLLHMHENSFKLRGTHSIKFDFRKKI